MSSIIPLKPFGKDLGKSLDDHVLNPEGEAVQNRNQDGSLVDPLFTIILTAQNSLVPAYSISGVETRSGLKRYQIGSRSMPLVVGGAFSDALIAKPVTQAEAKSLIKKSCESCEEGVYRPGSMSEYHDLHRSLWMNRNNPIFASLVEEVRYCIVEIYRERMLTLTSVDDNGECTEVNDGLWYSDRHSDKNVNKPFSAEVLRVDGEFGKKDFGWAPILDCCSWSLINPNEVEDIYQWLTANPPRFCGVVESDCGSGGDSFAPRGKFPVTFQIVNGQFTIYARSHPNRMCMYLGLMTDQSASKKNGGGQ